MTRRTLTWLAAFAAPLAPVSAAGTIDFNREIRPILSENCFQCHGNDPANRKGKLRLDEFAGATRTRDGRAAIVPGKPGESEMILRISSQESDEVMPPPEANKHLTPAQIELLKRWIAEGAEYQGHWAFLAPRTTTPPAVKNSRWPRHPVDRFVLARLEQEALAPSPEAAPATWLRRASFDLTGLPPTPAELDRFEADVKRDGDAAYARAADRLLASNHFGERLAMDWLDAARYADTHGFNNDSARSMWRWRDWVIEAFNANKPYDRFITEQLAGDLLPAPTLDQQIATGFNRNHVINSEGGIIDEEYRVEYVADRVRTVSTAWLGLTLECARCHDHKFDPITQKDYYRLFAFFNNVPEHGEDGRVANAVPIMPAPTRTQQALLATQQRELASLDASLSAARQAWTWQDSDRGKVEELLAAARKTANEEKGADLKPKAEAPAAEHPEADPVPPEDMRRSPIPGRTPATIPSTLLDFNRTEGLTLALWLQPAADNPRDVALFSNMDRTGSPAGVAYGRGSELRLVDGELELRVCMRFPVYALIVRTVGARLAAGKTRHIAVTYGGGRKAADVRIFIDGEEVPTETINDDLFGESPKRSFLVGTDNAAGAARWHGRMEEARSFPRALPTETVRALFRVRALSAALEAQQRGTATEIETGCLREALLATNVLTREHHSRRAQLAEDHFALRRSLPSTMVMRERPDVRPTFVLNRGQYDARGEPVAPGVPEALLAPWPAGAPRNRLGLAQWLTQPAHPLTARVVVNRFWAQLFGTGLVKTLEDFGRQGEWPSHPELLDWLARDFVDGGWNVKAFLKNLVLCATYRQSSAATPAQYARDPENRLLARGPRVRLPAELIRDQALAISGLLAPRIGGPSVYPYQPETLYNGVVVDAAYPGTRWGTSTDSDLYRRSLYTFWKRTVPHPLMTAFDAPDREFCTVRRSRTNTPMQALALWNEPGYLEAARRLGGRMLRDAAGDRDTQIAFAFQAATGRKPHAEEVALLLQTLTRLQADFAAHPDDAAALLKSGASAVDPAVPKVEAAAAMAVASMLLNLDETITKN